VPSGAVTGVDASETMIAEARRRTGGLGLPVAFEVGNATQLRFAENTFDACRTERMLMHIAEPARAFAEMVRVTKLSGRIAVFDFDWDTFVIDNPNRATTRRVVASFSDSIRSGWIGRHAA
jgi:ubiquinone/menaquinone biosynthesis C-methylase UbiE